MPHFPPAVPLSSNSTHLLLLTMEQLTLTGWFCFPFLHQWTQPWSFEKDNNFSLGSVKLSHMAVVCLHGLYCPTARCFILLLEDTGMFLGLVEHCQMWAYSAVCTRFSFFSRIRNFPLTSNLLREFMMVYDEWMLHAHQLCHLYQLRRLCVIMTLHWFVL